MAEQRNAFKCLIRFVKMVEQVEQVDSGAGFESTSELDFFLLFPIRSALPDVLW